MEGSLTSRERTGGEPPDSIASGTSFVELAGWRKISATGTDARAWLDDLVSADISELEEAQARRALFLSPTGRVRAEFTVAVPNGEILLLQDPVQARSILDLLGPYVLSSDVSLRDRTDELTLFAVPARVEPLRIEGGVWSAPSCTGPGVDVVAATARAPAIREHLRRTLTEVDVDDVDRWRIRIGRARFGVDAREEDLPQEAGLAAALSFGKGCFPGQEAVAKVRNLGHPRRLLVQVEAEEPLSPGDPIRVGGSAAGEITSAVRSDGITIALARVRWDAREGPLWTSNGTEVRIRNPVP